MYNFTVCWNDIKYIYVSHIVYSLTNWYRFIWNSCMLRLCSKKKGQERVYSSLNSPLLSYVARPFHLACKALLLINERKRRKSERKNFLFSSYVLARALHKKAHECFSITFHENFASVGDMRERASEKFPRAFPFARVRSDKFIPNRARWEKSCREAYLCVYDQGPN